MGNAETVDLMGRASILLETAFSSGKKAGGNMMKDAEKLKL